MNAPRFLLDTDTVSFLVKGRYLSIQQQLLRLNSEDYAISVITRSEMLYGLNLVSLSHPLQMVTRELLTHIQTLSWDQAAADVHSTIRAQLRKAGTLMADLDLMIAVHAISLGATLVTNNVRHFGRLQPELSIENWVHPD